METFKITVKELFNALEKNGFDHIRGSWFRFDKDGLVVGGCVLGQAAINLGAWEFPDEAEAYGSVTYALSNFTPTPGRWHTPINDTDDAFNSVAGQIIYWNDLTTEGHAVYSWEVAPEFYLKTWEEVVEMARECLTPYFDKEIELANFDWVAPNTEDRLFNGEMESEETYA